MPRIASEKLFPTTWHVFNSELTTEVIMIRDLYKSGSFTYKELGDKFEVSGNQISLIIKNKTWKHVNLK